MSWHGKYSRQYQNYNQRSVDKTVKDFKIATLSKHTRAVISSVQLPNTLTPPHQNVPPFHLQVMKVQNLLEVMLPLYMPWRHIEGVEVQFHSFFTLALNGRELSPLQATLPLGCSQQHPLRTGLCGLPELVCMFWRRENLLHLPWFESYIVQPMA